MKCKHANFILAEYVSVITAFYFVKGAPPQRGIGWHGEARPTGEIGVYCEDCAFERKYSSLSKAPEWVRDAWKRLMESQYPTCNPNIEEAHEKN